MYKEIMKNYSLLPLCFILTLFATMVYADYEKPSCIADTTLVCCDRFLLGIDPGTPGVGMGCQRLRPSNYRKIQECRMNDMKLACCEEVSAHKEGTGCELVSSY